MRLLRLMPKAQMCSRTLGRSYDKWLADQNTRSDFDKLRQQTCTYYKKCAHERRVPPIMARLALLTTSTITSLMKIRCSFLRMVGQLACEVHAHSVSSIREILG